MDKKSLLLELNKIYELRALLDKQTDIKEEMNIIHKLSLKIDSLEDMISKLEQEDSSTDTNSVDFQIKKLQDELKMIAKEYDDSCRKMQEIIEEQTKCVDNDSGLLSDEEIHHTREKYLEKKLEENKKSILLKDRMNQIIGQLNSLKENIIEGDHLEDKDTSIDVLENIELLCFLDKKCSILDPAYFSVISNSSFDNIKNNIQKRPEKIVDYSIEKLYIPGNVPKDMVIDSISEEDQAEEDKVCSLLEKIVSKFSLNKSSKNPCLAANIHISDAFAQELRKGMYDYDIVYSIHTVGAVDDNSLFELSSGLVQTTEMKDFAHEVKNCIIEELSDEEVKSLFDWYKHKKKKIGNCPIIHDYLFDDLNNSQ